MSNLFEFSLRQPATDLIGAAGALVQRPRIQLRLCSGRLLTERPPLKGRPKAQILKLENNR